LHPVTERDVIDGIKASIRPVRASIRRDLAWGDRFATVGGGFVAEGVGLVHSVKREPA
jgi:hypothetical protein